MQLNLETNTTFTKVSEIIIPDIFYRRLKTGVADLDDLFGNGLLPGSSFTVTARAGCGKTTFLLQLLEALSLTGYDVGYASGEENTFQLAFNCKRLNVKNLKIANITDIDQLAKSMEGLDAMVVDSFQALSSKDDLNSRELESYAVNTLVNSAKQNECVLFFVMHLTKAGVLKGGTLIPHTVDVNMEINIDDDSGDDRARIITFTKNRFGPCNEFSSLLTEKGFIFNGRRDTSDKALTKKQRDRKNKDAILTMKEPPHITKSRVMRELKLTSSQAYVLLKEMCELGQIQKFGRGDDAVFKVVIGNTL